MTDEIEDKNKDDTEALSKARENIAAWYSYYSTNIERGEDDKRFVYENQWDSVESASLRRLLKPELQINKVHDSVKKIQAQQRALDPQIQVMSGEYNSPNDPNSLIKLQKDINIRQDYIRTISYESNAKISFSQAFKDSTTVGYGAWCIKVKYENSKSFNQEIYIHPLTYDKVFFDPKAQEPNKTDGDYSGYFEVLSKDEFENQYPEIPYPVSFNADNSSNYSWGTVDKSITVAYYYYKEYFKHTLLLLSDNSTMYEDEYKKKQKEIVKETQEMDIFGIMGMGQQPKILPTIKKKRVVDDYKIYCREMISDKTIKVTEWPCKKLPVIYVDGDSYKMEGEQRTQSFIRHSKDPQRFLNYCAVEIADSLQKGRRETYIATDKMIAGKEKIWKNPSAQQGVLTYNFDKGEKPIVVPPSEVPRSLMEQYQGLTQDIQQTLGVYDANLGAPDSTAFSGKAISNRIRQGAAAGYVYQDNLILAQCTTGKIVLELMPTIIDSNRNIVLTGKDGKTRVERVNYRQEDDSIENDMTKSNFSVMIKAGPSYELQKQESVEMLIKLAQIDPQIFPMIADLIADNIEIANRPQLVERFKNLVPPEIIAKEMGEPPPPPKPNPQEQMAQQQQQMEQKKMQMDEQADARKFQVAQGDQQLKARQQKIDIAKLDEDHFLALLTGQTDRYKIDAEVHKTNTEFHSDMAKAIVDKIRIHSKPSGE